MTKSNHLPFRCSRVSVDRRVRAKKVLLYLYTLRPFPLSPLEMLYIHVHEVYFVYIAKLVNDSFFVGVHMQNLMLKASIELKKMF